MLIVPMRIEERLLGLLTLDHGGEVHRYSSRRKVGSRRPWRNWQHWSLNGERLLRERAERKRMRSRCRRPISAWKTFISIVSHELRTPVTSIKTNLQMVLRRVKQDREAHEVSDRLAQQLELLERMEPQIRRLTRLLDDVIDLARIRTSKLDIAVEPFDLRALLVEVARTEQASTPERIIQIVGPQEEAIPLLADPDRIGQVLTNYLTNALKYSPAERPVEMGLSLAVDHVRVWVRDQGPGIPLEEQTHLGTLSSRPRHRSEERVGDWPGPGAAYQQDPHRASWRPGGRRKHARRRQHLLVCAAPGESCALRAVIALCSIP